MEQGVMDDIVEQIDKLIRGWEREYGVTNQTMVNAKNEIERLREELLMSNTQLLIRRDMITHLKSGPGGIMEMKQTIADKEALINELLKTNWEKSWPTMRKYETFEEYRENVLK
jgi:Mg2+ and Co2+ transporter CorA